MIRRITGVLLFCFCLAIPFAYGQSSTTFPTYFPTYFSTQPSATTPLSGGEQVLVLQGGVVKQVAAGSVPNNLNAVLVGVRSSSAATVTVSGTTDYFLCLDPSSNAITVNLPATPSTGATFLIKDCTGNAAPRNITVTPAAGNIDGAATFVMNTNFESIAVTYTGAQWSVN